MLTSSEISKENNFELSLINPQTVQESLQLSRLNWHGVSLKFSNHYQDRQYKDLGIFKSSKLAAIKAAKDYENLVQKKQLQEYDHAVQLLTMKKKKEKAKHFRLITLLENHKNLEQKMTLAAISIQKLVRGFMIRKKYSEEIKAIQLKLLKNKVGILENAIENCLLHVSDLPNQAAILIQKNVKKIFAMRRFLKAKEEMHQYREKIKNQRIVKVQSLIRRYLAKKSVKIMREEKILKDTLEAIRKRLLICRLKDFWQRKKFVFETIRRKYAEVSEEISSKNVTEDDVPLSIHCSFEPIKSLSVVSSMAQSRTDSKKNTLVSREMVSQVPIISKPPKVPAVPKQLTLQYLKPTENYKNRTFKENQDSKSPINYKIRQVSHKRFQRNTKSRVNYITEVQNQTSNRIRAASADYKKNNLTVSRMHIQSPNSMNELIESFREIDTKKNQITHLLKKIEEPPQDWGNQMTIEKIYVYNPPKNQSISFKDALPDVNHLLETYAKNLRMAK